MESEVSFGFSCTPGYWINQWLLAICIHRRILKPKRKENETRIGDINAAISVLTAKGEEIPMEWVDELGDRVKAHNKALKA